MTDIIVLTFGNEGFTKRCFQSIKKHTDQYRLIWVDNGSGLDSVESVLPYAKDCQNMVPMWFQKNLGFVKGTNMALKRILETSKSEYICLLNNDVEVTAGWLSRMKRCLERNYNAGAVGPVTSECNSWQSYLNASQVVPSLAIPRGFIAGSLAERASILSDAYSDVSARCGMLAFFCTLFRRKVFDKIGILDEDFGVGYGEDDDFCHKMRDAKIEMLLSMGTYVFHNHQSTFKKIFSDKEICELKRAQLEIYKQKHKEEAKTIYVQK